MELKEKRTHIVTMRLTDSELEDLKGRAASNDYLSISKYIRTVVLGKRVPILKVKLTDRAIRNQINRLTAEVSKIGININQVVKKLNSLSKATKKNGNPVINTRQVVYYIRAFQNCVEKVIAKQEMIIDTISNLHNSSYSSHGTEDLQDHKRI